MQRRTNCSFGFRIKVNERVRLFQLYLLRCLSLCYTKVDSHFYNDNAVYLCKISELFREDRPRSSRVKTNHLESFDPETFMNMYMLDNREVFLKGNNTYDRF